MATLTLHDLRKSYGPTDVIKGVSLDVRDREFVVFVGPSGCGKSTLLRMIAGLEEISGGDLLIDGQRVNDVGPADRGLAMVFQSYALYPHMTVAQNMGFALRLARVPKAERDSKVADAARILQLGPYLERRPKDLSGGQRQRVAIGRAIVRNPRVFLFDEPLSNLDAALRGQMRIELARLHEELQATMIYVTHDQVEAMTMADKIVVLQAGKVEQVGSPLELYHHPANLFVAGFIGSPRMNMLPGRIVGANGVGVSVELAGEVRIAVPIQPGAVKPGDAVTLGIRPEALRPGTEGALAGEVRLVERLGGLTLLHIALQDGEAAIVQIEGSDATRAHQAIRLAVDPAACHLFDAAGLALPQLDRHPLVA
jgi:multiple sugar transport system ATP-binding protein